MHRKDWQYDRLLELEKHGNDDNGKLLRYIFQRDIVDGRIDFRTVGIDPTYGSQPEDTGRLFIHLTTKDSEDVTKREFDVDRSNRLHWIECHLREKVPDLLVFAEMANGSHKIYLLNRSQRYIVVLSKHRNYDQCVAQGISGYYLLTAHYICYDRAYERLIKKAGNNQRTPL